MISPAPVDCLRPHATANGAFRGVGYVLGDEGRGYWIGRAALRAVLRSADPRGPRTLLTKMLLQHFQVSQPQLLCTRFIIIT